MKALKQLPRRGRAKIEKKALVIFNPNAGIISLRNVEKMILTELESLGYLVELFYLNKKFESKIENRNLKNIDLVVAVGGDGTVKVAAKTILTKKIKAPLAIIPYGSANVVAMTLGLPLTIGLALKVIRQSDKIKKIDVGVVDKKHYFLVGLSLGYISKVVTTTSGKLKNKFGVLGYLIRFIFNNMKIRRMKFAITTKHDRKILKGNSLVIFNTFNYFGLKPKKNINLSDGILNLCIFTNISFLASLDIIFQLVWFSDPKRNVVCIDDNYFKININRGQRSCQIDGDYIKVSRQIEIEVLKRSLSIIIPAKNK